MRQSGSITGCRPKGIEQPDTFQQQIGERRNTAVNSVAMGSLPRGQKLRPLVSEFGHYVQFAIKPDMDAKIITKGSLGYLSSMYFSTSLVLGEVAAPFPQIEN